MEFKNVLPDILVGLESGKYKAYAEKSDWADRDYQEAINCIADLINQKQLGRDVLIAAAKYIKDSSDNVRIHEIKNYLRQHYRGRGKRISGVLKKYAHDSDVGELYDLVRLLNQVEGMSWFDWNGYVGSHPALLDGLHLVVVPATEADANSVFLFEDD